MKGIDIFNGTTVIDWNAIKSSGIECVYLKATEGLTFDDNKMRNFYNSAKSLGLKVGFYHFLRRNNPYQEAQHFLNAISGLSVDMKYMIDVEAPELQKAGQNETSTRVRQFYDYMASKGYECGIYTYSSFYKELFDSRVSNLPLWIAEYGANAPHINVPYIGFQYSETGHVNGIQGECDLDDFSDGILLGNSSVCKSPTHAISNNEDNTVKIIQQQLNTLLKKGLAVDGIKGQATDSAIKEFQSAMGLNADGIWGQHTINAVTEIFNRPIDGVPYPHYEYATRYIQYRVGGNIDGSFGNGTKTNVQNWQMQHGLNADGVVGSATWSKLLDENC